MRLVLIFILSPFAFGNSLEIKPEISRVVSVDGEYNAKYSNQTRERFIVGYALGSETSQKITIESFAPGKTVTPDKVISKYQFLVSNLPVIKAYISKVAKKSQEATYGCCNISNIEWNKWEWTFSVSHKEVQFNCRIRKNGKASCSK